MDRSKMPSAAFEWSIDTITIRCRPVKDRGHLEWSWIIDYIALPADLQKAVQTFEEANTGRNLTDTPQGALDSLSSEQMDVLEKLIEWVQS